MTVEHVLYMIRQAFIQLMFAEGFLCIKYLGKVRARLIYSMLSWRSLMEEDSWTIITKILNLYKHRVLEGSITV